MPELIVPLRRLTYGRLPQLPHIQLPRQLMPRAMVGRLREAMGRKRRRKREAREDAVEEVGVHREGRMNRRTFERWAKVVQ